MENEAERLRNEIERLKQVLQQHKQSVFHLQRENRRLQSLTDQQRAEATQSKQRLDELEQERASLQTRLTQVQADLGNLQATRTVRLSRTVGLLRQSLRHLTEDWRAGPFIGALDPASSDEIILGESLKISGWIISRKGRIQSVEVWLDDTPLGPAYYGVERPEVRATRPLLSTPDCGFAAEFAAVPPLVVPGSKKLSVRVIDSKGNQQSFDRTIVIAPPPLPFSPSQLKPFNYPEWIAINEPGEAELQEQREKAAGLKYRPLLSLVSYAESESERFLGLSLEAILNQTYDNWELWLVGSNQKFLEDLAGRDPRIHCKVLPSNPEQALVASVWNSSLDIIKGEYVAFLKEGAALAPNALYENARLLNQHPEAALIYSDEDKGPEKRCLPEFKPDWSPDLFYSSAYTGQLALYQTALVRKVGGFRANYYAAQEYDLTLRLLEHSKAIYHIPRLLYHGPLNQNPDPNFARAAQVALREHCERLGIKAEVTTGLVKDSWRVKYLLEDAPKVSIIIPTRDQVQLLRQCVDSVQHLTAYPNFEIVIVDNNSVEAATFDYFNALRDEGRIRVLSYPHEFNFAAINNFAVSQITGELILFLNNDIEVTAPAWLEALIEHAIRPEVGAVGARLLYPDGSLQHGGVVIGVGGQAGHAQKHLPGDAPGYLNRAKVIQNFSAVTGACLMIRTALFRELGGFEESLAVAFNDVDLCLRLREKGLLMVWTPYAELIHHESVSRGRDEFDPIKTARFRREVQYMHRHWEHIIRDDPYYNPNLTIELEDFSIAPLSRYRE